MNIARAAATTPYRAVSADDVRIDAEIGDGNGWVDAQELVVAVASREVFELTGLNLRPKLLYGVGASYTAADAYGSYTVYDRRESASNLGPIVFHEAGHVAHGDAIARDLPDPALELRADAYAGALIRSAGENLTEAVAFRSGRGTDVAHGTPQQGAVAMIAGFDGRWW